MFISFISGIFVLSGTYLLSKNVFEQSIQRLINVPYENLPRLVKMAVVFFGYKNRFISQQLWNGSNMQYPMKDNLSFKMQYDLLEPFLGFFLIFIGVLIQVFFG